MTSVSDLRVAITGGTGYLGSWLTSRFVADGTQVAVLCRPDSSLDLLGEVATDPRVSVVRLDDSPESLVAPLADHRPDLVVHMASLFVAEHTADLIRPLLESNLVFGTHLLEAMARVGCRHLVNAGTAWQHYHTDGYSPANLYAATKQAFEDIALFYHQAHGIDLAHLHLFDTYGPGDPRQKVVSKLIDAAMEGEPLPMSPGEQQIDLVYVDDVADAFRAAGGWLLTRPSGARPCNEVFAVSSGAPLALRDLVSVVEQEMGRPVPAQLGALPYRDREIMTAWTGGVPVPGWVPRTPLREGIARTIRDRLRRAT